MPRGERPLEPGDGVVVRFARDLRLLRGQAGAPTYRELSARAHYSAAALSEAAGGRKLPSLSVTIAYVAACDGDTAEWEARWRTTAAELATTKAEPSGDRDLPPYVGLAAFQREDSGRFFGREKLVADLMLRLRQRRFLGLVGSSGCGKSSLLRAGLVAHLVDEREQDSAPVVVFTPGQHPIEECAVHVAGFLEESPGTLRDEFSADPRNVHLRIRQAVADCATEADAVVVVDQFEELFTLCSDEREQNSFIDALVIAATDSASRARVVLGIRADFLGHCGQHHRLVNALRDAQVLVGPMTTDELRLAITGPAERAGYRVETALVTRLVADATRQPGMLPLVSHALWQTWLRRQGKVMTVSGYDAVGGIEHALARSAEDCYQALDADQQNIAQQIFLRLTALGEGTEDTKRRITRDELNHHDPNTALILDSLTRARLTTLGHNSVEIAHEALIRHWPRLRDWLTEDRETHRIHRQLTEAAIEWERQQRDEGLLYRGARLAAWQDRSLERLNDMEHAFLTASRRAVEREHRLRRRRVRLTIGGLSSATAIVAVLAMIAMMLAGQADSERTLAVSRQLAADARAQLQIDPELGLLLAREAYAAAPNNDTESLLRQAVADSHLRATLPAHRDSLGRLVAITGVAFSADGKHLATTTGDGVLQVFDWHAATITPTPARVLRNSSYARSPVFSPDGRRIAFAGSVATVWDWTQEGEPTMPPPYREHAVTTVAHSPDGQWVASGGWNGTIRIRLAASNDQSHVLGSHDGGVSDVVFSADGTRLVSSSDDDGTIRIWDLVNGGDPLVLRSRESQVTAVTVSPDGQHLATAGVDGTVRTWDLTNTTTSTVLGTHDGPAYDVEYSTDGHSILSTGADGTVRIWNADHNTTPVVLRGHHGPVPAATFTPDGNTVVSAGSDGTTKIWAVDEAEDITVLRGLAGPVRSAAPSPDKRLIAVGGEDGTVQIRNLTGDIAPVTLSGLGGPVAQVTFSPDGRRLAAVDRDGIALVWNLTSSRTEPVQQRPYSAGRVSRVAFSPDSTRLAAAIGTMDSVWIWDIPETEHPDDDSRTGMRAGYQGGLHNVAWSPDGHHLAAASQNNTVLMWDLRTDARPTLLRGHQGRIWGLAFSPDGTHLASGSDDGTINIWTTTTPTADPIVLRGHQGSGGTITFTPDSRHLLTSGNNTTVRIWKTDSTSDPLILDSFRAAVQAIVPIANNRYFTAHNDGTIRTWRCPACGPITEVLTTADQNPTRELTPQERQTYLPTNP